MTALYRVGAMIACAEHLPLIEAAGYGFGLPYNDPIGVLLTEDEKETFGRSCPICDAPAIPDRTCALTTCGKALHPQWPAVYCSTRCAIRDA